MGVFWLQSCRELGRLYIQEMTRSVLYLTQSAAVAMLLLYGCSTMSRTEKQLARVDFLESPDIPSPGVMPPLRPTAAGLEFAKDVLVINYDVEIGKEPLKKAIRKYGASIIYDYRIGNSVVVRIPDPAKQEEAVLYFEKVKGVLQVSRERK